MAERLRLVCLDPRKDKRRVIAAALAGLGDVAWVPLLGVSALGWPETAARAEAALQAARGVPAGGVARAAKLALLRGQYNAARARFARDPAAVAVAWNGLNGTRAVFMQAARDAGARRLYFELAPLPGRITVDPCGVNHVNSLPRAAEPYLRWFAQSGLGPDDWRAVGRAIVQRPGEAGSSDAPPMSSPFLFVPLQVPGDSQLRLFGGAYPTVGAFVQALIPAARALPQGWHLRIKEHPGAGAFVAGLLAGRGDAPVFLDNATDTFAQVRAARGVVTVNSSVGIEAMFHDQPVVACGQCFWAIPGVADHAPTPAALVQVCRGADKLSFDPATRAAFLSYLDRVYYPQVDRAAGTAPATTQGLIRARLAGRDAFGFWDCGS